MIKQVVARAIMLQIADPCFDGSIYQGRRTVIIKVIMRVGRDCEPSKCYKDDFVSFRMSNGTSLYTTDYSTGGRARCCVIAN